MPLLLALPHEELAEFVDSYGTYDEAVPANHIFVANLIAFNPLGAPIELDGQRREERTLFCITHDPSQVEYRHGEGAIFFIRMRGGGFDRLLHIDPADGAGIRAPDAQRHAILLELEAAVAEAVPSPEAVFAAFDRVLRALVPAAKPPGLAQRYFELVAGRGGDVTIAGATELLGCTSRTLERACKRRFGRSPKRLARGYRAATTFFREWEEGGRPETSAEFAYADLAHYANDLRDLTGLTRREHFRQIDFDESLPLVRVWPGGHHAVGEEDNTRWVEEYRRRARDGFS